MNLLQVILMKKIYENISEEVSMISKMEESIIRDEKSKKLYCY